VATGSAREAQRLLGQRLFDVLVVDNLMPELTGTDLIRELVASTSSGERPQILMMTAHATVENAIEAMKLGALDYLQKPFEIDELLVLVNRALEHQRLSTEHQYLISERDAEFNHYGIVGRSRRMQDVINTSQVVAKSKSTILITGETGTGKEMVARAIHFHSAQREMPLIKVNCAAIPETLLESELFGHTRGAFTGATTNKKGKFALADGGTIFLDEIGTMSPTLQAKLLRVLQEREFEPLGSERTQKVDVRVIAATNRDLRQMVSDGRFQEDLYYRLNVIPIHIPPLRDRREDGQAHRRPGTRSPRSPAGCGLAGQRKGAREYGRARRGSVPHPHDRTGRGALPRSEQCESGRFAVAEPAPEPRLGRTRDRPARARQLGGREERRRRSHGNQSARPELLPGETQGRVRCQL
jgi:DNA-binding NtrC family response regulator